MADKARLAFRLAVLPVLVGGILFLEIIRPFSLFRLFTFILLFAFLADLTSLLRGKLRDLLLMATSLVFGLCLLEAACDVFVPSPRLVTTHGLTVPRPVVGWGPGHPGRFHAEKFAPKTGAVIYDVDYTIDSDLLRETQSCASCATIAFFGGSFTFGEGVNDADTLPQKLANALDRKMRIVNLGYSGYGAQQFLRELQTGLFDKAIGTKPKLFVFLTAPWHTPRSVCKASWVFRGPRYALENGKVTYKGPCYQGARLGLHEWMEHTASYRLFVEPPLEKLNHSDVDLYIRMVLAAVHLAKEKYGVPTLVPFIRAKKGYLRGTGFTDDEIIKRLQDGGAIVVDVSLLHEKAAGATITIPGGTHPTPYANQVRASILKSYIEQHLGQVLAAEPRPADKVSPTMRE